MLLYFKEHFRIAGVLHRNFTCYLYSNVRLVAKQFPNQFLSELNTVRVAQRAGLWYINCILYNIGLCIKRCAADNSIS